MRIFEVRPDYDFIWLKSVKDDDVLKLDEAANGDPQIPFASPLELEPIGEYVETDFPRGPGYGSLLLSEVAVRTLQTMLRKSGYLIGVKSRNLKTAYSAFIPTVRLDAVDHDQSQIVRFTTGRILQVNKFSLKEACLIGHDIMQLKGVRARLYVSENFLSVVEQDNLSGFIFTEIWSSETGGVVLPGRKLPSEGFPGELERRAEAKRKAFLHAEFFVSSDT